MRWQSAPCPQCGRPDDPGQETPTFCPDCRFPLRPVAGKYRLMRRLARGGGGTVYLAHHTRLTHEKERVIKVLHHEIFEEQEHYVRFMREVEVTALLSQKNHHIVRIYDDFGEEPWLGAFYVMEYLQGHTLKQFLKRYGRVSLELSLHIFAQFCEAINAAHQEAIIHRDLKPPNLYLIQQEADPYFLKVIDFGIARSEHLVAQQDLTQGTMGTPSYMSPEQCTNGAIDGRTDIYAMGTILYEMLGGEVPFSSPKGQPRPPAWAVMQRHIEEPPMPLLQRFPDLDIPPALDRVILRALQKSPEHRQSHVMEFWAELQAAAQAGASLPALGMIPPFPAGATPSPEPTLPSGHSLEPNPAPPLDPPPQPRRPWREWLGGGIMAALVVGLGLWWMRPAPRVDVPRVDARRSVSSGSRSPTKPRKVPQFPRPLPARGACVDGATRLCFLGPRTSRPPCKPGRQRCSRGAWGACVGARGPRPEVCNGKDDDCDGKIDEDFPKKGQPCTSRRFLCTVKGRWGCHPSKPHKLRCEGSLGRRGWGRSGRVMFRISPSRLRVRLRIRGRSFRARGRFCADLLRSSKVRLSARGYHRCLLTVPARNFTLRLRLKRKSDLDEVHDYCKR